MANDIKSDIQDTATHLFHKYGLRSVSIDDICNELHISKKTFYANFSQKEELIESILIKKDLENTQQIIGKFHSQKESFQAGNPNTIDRLMKIAGMSFNNFKMVQQAIDCDNFMYDLLKYYPDIHNAHLQRIHHDLHQHITTIIQKGIDEGLFRPESNKRIISDMITFQYIASIKYIFERFEKADQKDAAFTLIDSQLRILCNEKGLDYYNQRLREQANQANQANQITDTD